MPSSAPPPRILLVGGGYVGMYAALRLQRRLKLAEARITVVDPLSYMTYQPFLPEAGAGNLEPRHVVVPLRRVLKKCEVLSGYVTAIEHARKVAYFRPHEGPAVELPYDIIVVAPGSVSRTLPIPGLREQGVGFKTVTEAIYLRNHVLSKLDIAASTTDPAVRERALTFCFIGGGYAGVEALAELEDMAHAALKFFPRLRSESMRWVLVEAAGRILPEVGPDLGVYTVEQLVKRRIEVRLNTRVESMVGGCVVLDDGTTFDTETIVWTAGVKPNPMLASTDLPLDDKGRIKANAYLNIEGTTDAWTAGDCARVPDLTTADAFTSPSAQHAVRQARLLASNVIATVRGSQLEPYLHSYAGSVASLGLYKGVAQIYGIKMRGFPAWFMHRSYHMTRMPTFNRKVRVLSDWTLALFFEREIVSLGTFSNPRREFEVAAAEAPMSRPAASRAQIGSGSGSP